MKITFYGATKEVTGSKHLITINNINILFDYGMHQGKRSESTKMNKRLPIPIKDIDFLILSHAHIDHSGLLPLLIKNGYSNPIYCTKATEALIDIMLRDSGHIQEMDVEYINRRKIKRGEAPVKALYTVEDAQNVMPLVRGVKYYEKIKLTEDIYFTLYDAGHILGSSQVVLEYKEDKQMKKLLFTGDIGRDKLPIIRDPDLIENVDTMISESTYGGRLHGDITDVGTRFKDIINKTYSRGGKIVIPSFSVGRTQEVVYTLNKLTESHQVPLVPVYVDSPLSVNATEIFRKHRECYDDETWYMINNHDDPFGFKKLVYIKDVEESKNLNNSNKPCIIISASGMCEAGRIRHHLKHNISDSKNTIMIVGYMAKNTLGRRIRDGEKEVKIFGDIYPVNADVILFDEFSAHGDQNDLIKHIKIADPKELFLVHGEETQIKVLKSKITELSNIKVNIPDLGSSFEL